MVVLVSKFGGGGEGGNIFKHNNTPVRLNIHNFTNCGKQRKSTYQQGCVKQDCAFAWPFLSQVPVIYSGLDVVGVENKA